jgi:hypothetical protein
MLMFLYFMVHSFCYKVGYKTIQEYVHVFKNGMWLFLGYTILINGIDKLIRDKRKIKKLPPGKEAAS